MDNTLSLERQTSRVNSAASVFVCYRVISFDMFCHVLSFVENQAEAAVKENFTWIDLQMNV